MHADFWHHKWQINEIGFHESQVNPWLVKHFHQLSVPPGGRVFVPLCGKSLDMAWLLSQGHAVVGAELSPIAVQAFFDTLGVAPTVTPCGPLQRYSAQGIDIFLGDIFELGADTLGPVHAVYDRAAMVALPEGTRPRYARHVQAISHRAPQLLVCFEYDQTQLSGPPFAVPAAELQQHFAGSHQLQLLASEPLPGGLKGKCPAHECVWLAVPVQV